MASNIKVANRYANSLIGNAIEKQNLDKVYEDMQLLLGSFDVSRELKRAIESPVIRPEVKLSIIDELFKNRMDKDSLNFIHFVIEKRRENVLYEIAKRFLELRDEHLGIVNIDVKTAFEFVDEQKQKLKEKFEYILSKKAMLRFRVDETLIGGFIAQVGDTVFDASLKHQLELLKKEFVRGGLSLN